MIRKETILAVLKADDNFIESTLTEHIPDSFTELTYDSRKVSAESLFFVKGAGFKKEFLEKAIESGLTTYISEVDFEMAIPAILVKDVKQAMSLIAMEFHDHPEEKLKLLAFTGTKGKTTAAYFAYTILSQSHQPAMLSTMNTTLDGQTFFKSNLTTPESLDLIAMMAEAVQNGRTHLVMEVSSQAYLMKRVYGLTFDVGVFLNITPDHIGPIEHPNFEDYFYHKRLLLANSKAVIVNAGMNHVETVLEEIKGQDYDLYGDQTENAITESHAFDFTCKGKVAEHYDIQLIGRFNQENAIAAGLACLRLGASLSDVKAGVAATSVPGRMEVLTQKNGAKIFVDYAHNGDSLEKLLSVVAEHQKGKNILIIGSTGNKAESRRADFGRVINEHPELEVILTADDPNREDPQKIAEEIASYVERDLTILPDRIDAIKAAMQLTTNETDAVIIAGKGADCYQIVNDQKMDYPGDLAVAKEYL